ncbi:tRNA uridine-5-carboxymethylaminomethyl(34) synthesis enzyme MnmG [Archangium primigenium]|uniref:tRNA uridine-5-carboxymethylaminomethyl(34) synthesis enzyme MnmG n=1 Tax=[Archangium] primigenium TaxID=2792470 RepID=UPI00195A81BB|nr:tRNA uridine-5-carboxymethylaminomethyl(34) synthesis enzyme MnmG [Archangium primigenium]MBM7112527.1 tRNA uridine-5-carboxymethylaminomethyl(34) synthesis enzyme MnmG [Archangium primigenium]
MKSRYDVIVVGLGHAGCEAALACARMGLSTLGLTLKRERAAVMSCNPAVGGTAKGHLVRELDALGGEMARVADLTGTHFKTLNASKGPAVQATRVLCDRDAYARVMQSVLFSQPGLTVHEAEVSAVRADAGRVSGVTLADGTELAAAAVLLTTGTFLQALMHVGEKKEVGGRLGDEAAKGMSDSLRALGFTLGRFKTGTPARLLRDSIDWAALAPQPGDFPPRPLSLRTRLDPGPFPLQPAVTCALTYTTDATHQILRDNLHRSPLYQGEIVGRGPRYCPSLEDKVVRFSARERHLVFLEPEGPTSPLVYPAGLSTSLPADVQLAFLRTLPGLGDVQVARYGYAVEYDYAPPTQLHPTLETKRVRGLYFAGQLNGTSGYEEAAFQGLYAGIQAALQVKGEPVLELGRHEAHGAVLVDELVTRGVDGEPFRMFTSRSEHRLRLREGNADLRLVRHGARVGLVGEEVAGRVAARGEAVAGEVARLKRSGLAARLKRPEVTYAVLAAEAGGGEAGWPVLAPDVVEEVEVEVKYEGYIVMAERAAAREAEAWDGWRIPGDFAYEQVRGLSAEALEKFEKHRPGTVGQARRIPGLTPAAFSLLLVALKREGRGPGGGERADG